MYKFIIIIHINFEQGWVEQDAKVSAISEFYYASQVHAMYVCI